MPTRQALHFVWEDHWLVLSPLINAQVLLFVERNKLPGLKRLLEAGGATVVTRITTTILKEVTHAFIAMAQFPKEV